MGPFRRQRQPRRAARFRHLRPDVLVHPAGGGLARGSGNGVITADQSDATFKVWQDPDGFNDYCDATNGTKVLERGIDPFLEFLRSPSPG